MKYLLFVLVFIISMNIAAEATTEIVLAEGIKVEVKEFLPSRLTPTLYQKQAMESIPVMYPDSVIITNTGFGNLDSNNNVSYSLVSYIETPKSLMVVSGGEVLVGGRAWRFHAIIPEELYEKLQHTLIKKVANLAF